MLTPLVAAVSAISASRAPTESGKAENTVIKRNDAVRRDKNFFMCTRPFYTESSDVCKTQISFLNHFLMKADLLSILSAYVSSFSCSIDTLCISLYVIRFLFYIINDILLMQDDKIVMQLCGIALKING